MRLADNQYLLYLQCFTGAYQPGGVYFLFSTVTGIQTQPLRLTKLSGYESNSPKEVPITDRDSPAIAGYHQFNPAKRELILLHRCDGQWRCFSQSRYTLIKDQMVLQEYVIGSRNLDTKDKRYRTYQLIRDGDRWISSGIMLCEQRELASCSK
ncbi:hypothetical protein [Pantanalinema sp. GBBB05]|uniref:hypothetical protein n=1 Tax=Pantanalinema sp. GBBB05 TaxID=2604139 RepID=UPI001E114A74|nr:hypothetical protein [Pantanalinema sp. GBBB05]